ncbi:hypothetical protein FSARC_3624 [Fusarium sarcochroum]|uniref:WSC domain-containing protein n=1 Tax=Fusarium sarcochroum TaxID=1208366 RepID=A0A8H4XBM2_9HYPO|nr:hypothetical protein FSARC_3624 [Fusarium sarcochroum]
MAYNAFTLFCLFASAAGSVHRDIQHPVQDPILNQMTSQGCWDSLPAEKVKVYSGTYLASGYCGQLCKKKDFPVAILHLSTCYCANTYPPEGSLVDDAKCDWPCPGYANEACGGMDDFSSVLNTGLELAPDNDDESSAPSSKSSSDSTSTTSVLSDSATATTAASTVSTAHSEEASTTNSAGPSTVADSTSDSNATSTPGPSPSTVPNNASGRLASPVGNLVRMLRNLL